MRRYYVFLLPDNRVLVKHENEPIHPSIEHTALDTWYITARTKNEAIGKLVTNLYNAMKGLQERVYYEARTTTH